MISDQSPGASGVRNNADDAAAGQIADAELRLIRILQQRGRLVARAFDGAPTVQRLLQAGLVRAVERPGAEVILVLSGDGLRVARAH
jgi:hypothetical protein